MSKITRPPKEGGFSTYTDKVAAGFTAIIDSEVDNDFKTIYSDYDGNVDDSNIRARSLHGNRDLVQGSVTGTAAGGTGEIDESTLHVQGGNITNLSITLQQLALGAAVAGSGLSPVGGNSNSGATGERTCASTTFTSRGGYGFAIATLNGNVASFVAGNLIGRIRLDGAPIATVQAGIATNEVTILGMPILGIFFAQAPGTHTVAVSLATDTNGISWFVTGAQVFVLEVA